MLTHRQVLEVIAAVRGEQVVITTMGSMGLWPELSDTPLDFAYVPSSMGQGIPLGLGLALAQPSRGVIAVIGDGSLLMNLGVLVTVASHPAPLHVVLIDNGVYEVTGGQPTPGSGRTDFAGLARAAGIERVFQFDALPAWAHGAAEALGGTDPSFVWLKVDRQIGSPPPPPSRPIAEQISQLHAALGLSARPADPAANTAENNHFVPILEMHVADASDLPCTARNHDSDANVLPDQARLWGQRLPHTRRTGSRRKINRTRPALESSGGYVSPRRPLGCRSSNRNSITQTWAAGSKDPWIRLQASKYSSRLR